MALLEANGELQTPTCGIAQSMTTELLKFFYINKTRRENERIETPTSYWGNEEEETHQEAPAECEAKDDARDCATS